MSMTPEEIQSYTQEVAQALGETDTMPMSQIAQIIEAMGRDFVKENLEKTEEIEAGDGIKTDDGKRRRTKGGVFFYLVKGKMESDIRKQIFPNFGKRPKTPVVAWEKRQDFIDDLIAADEAGNMRYVQVTLHGRPGKIVTEGDTVMTTIQHTHKETPLPRGVPHPPQDQATFYTVYLAKKQWEEVEATLKQYRADRMIVEGTLFYDQATQSVAVMGTKVTTRRQLKDAKKERDAAADQAAIAGEHADDEALVSNMLPGVPVPDGMPADVASKLSKLHQAAETYRKKIADMEAKGQKGISMTKTLLRNTEKQIEVLERQYPS